jgi:hypothetical protein
MSAEQSVSTGFAILLTSHPTALAASYAVFLLSMSYPMFRFLMAASHVCAARSAFLRLL